jgi:hypothetical protein
MRIVNSAISGNPFRGLFYLLKLPHLQTIYRPRHEYHHCKAILHIMTLNQCVVVKGIEITSLNIFASGKRISVGSPFRSIVSPSFKEPNVLSTFHYRLDSSYVSTEMM